MTVTGPSVDVFHGVRVVELAQFVFVPVAGALLADWGADVIKIEHPVTGDGYRGLVSQGILRIAADGLNHSMEMANRGKRGVGIDVNTPAGRQVLLELVATADVFLTNFRPSALERLGLTVDALRDVNPSIIYARGHGFGVRGPDADAPGSGSGPAYRRGARRTRLRLGPHRQAEGLRCRSLTRRRATAAHPARPHLERLLLVAQQRFFTSICTQEFCRQRHRGAGTSVRRLCYLGQFGGVACSDR